MSASDSRFPNSPNNPSRKRSRPDDFDEDMAQWTQDVRAILTNGRVLRRRLAQADAMVWAVASADIGEDNNERSDILGPFSSREAAAEYLTGGRTYKLTDEDRRMASTIADRDDVDWLVANHPPGVATGYWDTVLAYGVVRVRYHELTKHMKTLDNIGSRLTLIKAVALCDKAFPDY